MSVDDLRRLMTDMQRRVEVLERALGFAAVLEHELGISAELEVDDGDLIIVVPQILLQDRSVEDFSAAPATVRFRSGASAPEEPAEESFAGGLRSHCPPPGPAQHCLDGIAVAPLCDDGGDRQGAACEDDGAAELAVGAVSDPGPGADPITGPSGEPAGWPAPGSRNGMMWEPWEDELVAAGIARGDAPAMIAVRLGRTTAAVRTRRTLEAVQRRIDELELAALAAGSAEAPAGPEDRMAAFAPSMPGVPGWLRELRARLDALGHEAPWTPDLDWRLVAGLSAGRKCADLAPVLGVTTAQARARFIALLPEPGIEAQARVLKELEARAGAAPDAAA